MAVEAVVLQVADAGGGERRVTTLVEIVDGRRNRARDRERCARLAASILPGTSPTFLGYVDADRVRALDRQREAAGVVDRAGVRGVFAG
ncbi:MAG: hypothetical protein DLM58_21665 [Pseudonocardiales bacterium]|nr:MAG: hypothetical protein DLM58_21665 [Pseudonocardiales bacterium]